MPPYGSNKKKKPAAAPIEEVDPTPSSDAVAATADQGAPLPTASPASKEAVDKATPNGRSETAGQGAPLPKPAPLFEGEESPAVGHNEQRGVEIGEDFESGPVKEVVMVMA